MENIPTFSLNVSRSSSAALKLMIKLSYRWHKLARLEVCVWKTAEATALWLDYIDRQFPDCSRAFTCMDINMKKKYI